MAAVIYLLLVKTILNRKNVSATFPSMYSIEVDNRLSEMFIFVVDTSTGYHLIDCFT